MTTRIVRAQMAVWLLAIWVSASVPPRAEAQPIKLTAEELKKIASAVPHQAAATPLRPRRLLVFTLCKGYYHASIPHGAKAIELMGEKTGAFKAIVSDDIAMFQPDSLRQFDGLCLMSALGEFFLPDNLDALSPVDRAAARTNDLRLKQNLLAYIKGGKGLAGIHGGSYAFNQWPEFGEVLGASFDSHPWNSTERIAVKVEEPMHPVVAAFRGCDFDVIDEGYQFKHPYSRSRVRLLLSLDTLRMDMNKKGLRSDGDFGISWVKRYGQGRVFYSALGHNPEEFWNPQLLRHYLDGIQFALGDLAAEAP